MAAVGDDCYFFFTSSCSKGPSCPFRHVEAAKACKIICQHWQRGGCFRPMCMFRHSDFQVQVDVSEVPCYWETQPIGCRKPTCAYKHVKPRPTNMSSLITTDAGTAANSSSTVSTASPAVKPIIIQPESEDSNASPEKRPPQTETRADDTGKAIGEKQSEESRKAEEVAEDDDAEKIPTEPVKKKIKKKIVKTKVAAKTTTPKVKKVVKKVPVKKKKVPGTEAAVKKKVAVSEAAVKKKVAVSESVVKKKKQVMKKEKLKSPMVSLKRKTVKERLGRIPTGIQGGGSVSDDSGSDSDDSIENIKVLSMEEILRQKALESMMRKKAAEGKSVVPQPLPAKRRNVQKTVKAAAPKQKVSPPSSSSSSEEEEEVEEEEESEESSSSSSNDSSESESSSSSDNPDVRRVIVDVESEKAARKRAKASLMKKGRPQLSALHSLERSKGGGVKKAKTLQQAQTLALQKKKVGKKRLVNMDIESMSPVHSNQKAVSVRERLGLPVKESKGLKAPGDGDTVPLMSLKVARATGQGAGSPRKTVITSEREQESKGESSSNDGLEGIKVKTLEEIRLEKMKKLAARDNLEGKSLSPVRQRLGLSKAEEEDAEKEERQVLLVTEAASQNVGESVAGQDVPKKVRRRPWRSQKAWQPEAAEEKGDQRLAVVTSVVPTAEDKYEAELNQYKQDRGLEESPFESLKRRALLKKVLAAKARKLERAVSSGGDAKGEMHSPGRTIMKDVQGETSESKGGDEDADIIEAGISSKKHKHKRKSKHHKKSKTERQIYMPPALKNSVSLQDSLASPENLPEPVSEAANPAPTQMVKVPPMRRGHHPIAAAWAAGLSLSAKGTGKRPPQAVPTAYTDNTPVQTSQKVQIAPRENKIAVSSEASGVTIKSFSEIMAEKRRRRLEQQAQKDKKPVSVSIAGPEKEQSTSPLRDDSRPRVPITPIIFSTDKPKPETSRSQVQPDPVSSVGFSTARIPPLLGQMEPSTAALKHTGREKEQWNSSQAAAQGGRITNSMGDNKLKSQKKLFKKKSKSDVGSTLSTQNPGTLSNTAAQEQAPSFLSTSASSPAFVLGTSQSTVSSSTSLSSFNELGQSGRETLSVSQNDGAVPSTGTSLCSPPPKSPVVGVVEKHKSPVEVAEPSQKKSRSSLDDEFSFLDTDDDFTPSGDILVGDVEPIDDLLQDIDDLLA